jgi:hypothetical protein
VLFTQATLAGIADGGITLAFRRWHAARVREGTSLRTAVGVVGVTSVAAIDLEDITPEDARRAGFTTLRALIDELHLHRDGQLYRIALRFHGRDPLIALRERNRIGPDERDSLLDRLGRLGARAADGPWAIRTLQLIEAHPASRAAKLARMAGLDTLRFKRRVRQLKELGLIESLEIGYRLSPRGRAVLQELPALRP